MTEIVAAASAIFCSYPPAVVTTMVSSCTGCAVLLSCACTETPIADITAKAKLDFNNGLFIPDKPLI